MACDSQSTSVMISDVLIQPVLLSVYFSFKVFNCLFQYVDITLLFSLQHVRDDTFCSLELCVGEGSGDNCSSHCGITIHNTSPESADEYGTSESDSYSDSENGLKSDTDDENEDTMMEMKMDDSEPCPSSKWLWITHSSNEGEAHFLIRDDVATAVSVQNMGYSYVPSIK